MSAAAQGGGHRLSEPFGDPMGDVSRDPPRDMQKSGE